MSEAEQTEIVETKETVEAQKTESSLSQFAAHLNDFYSSGDIKANFRLMKDGLFVRDDALDELFTHYSEWLMQRSGGDSSVSAEKLRKRFFGDRPLPLSYLLDGKICLSGVLLKDSLEHSLRTKIPFSQSSLFDASRQLNPRDPKLETIEGVNVQFSQTKGFSLTLKTEKQHYTCECKFVERFAEVAKQIPELVKAHTELKGPVRDVLPLLLSILTSAIPFKENQRGLIPERYKNDKSVFYLASEALVFVGKGENLLIDIYAINRKNLKTFIIEEIKLFTKGKDKPKYKGVYLTPDHEWKLGTVQIKRESYVIHQDVLCDIISKIRFSPSLRKACKGRYTVFTCIDELLSMLEKGTLVHTESDAKDPKAAKEPLRYIKHHNWRFMLRGKNVIAKAEERLPKNKESKK